MNLFGLSGVRATHLLLSAGLASTTALAETGWTDTVQVEGQMRPVPAQWLQTSEGRTAYSLKLPPHVPGTVPFDFDAAASRARWPGGTPVNLQYFHHLCSSEAGEWVFRKENNVTGFYFARPGGMPNGEAMTHPFGPEMPWIQRWFISQGTSPMDLAGWFVAPPFRNYTFIEQPNTGLAWQASFTEPYVRSFGMAYGPETDEKGNQMPGRLRLHTPMQAAGIERLASRFGYTWRAVARARDRENNIAGGEILIYDLQTHEVLAMRRQFLLARSNPRLGDMTMWEIAATCKQDSPRARTYQFSDFVVNVLQPPAVNR